MLLKRRLLRLLLLLAATLSCQGAQKVVAAAAPRRSSRYSESESRIKLCGREFLHAVTYLCGASRWRRVGEQQQQRTARGPLPGSARTEFVQANGESGLKNINPRSLSDFKLEQLQSDSQPASQPSRRDQRNLYEEHNDHGPISDEFSDYPSQIANSVHKRGEAKLVTSMESYNFHPRRKRNFSVEIAVTCCLVGCTSAEISAFC